MSKTILVWILVLVTLPSAVYAGGYRVSLQGVRQAALGAQGSALSHDASVAFFNPAALAFVDSKLSVAVGGFGINVTAKYQNPQTLGTAETNNPMGTPLYAAISYKPIDDLAVGVSFTTPFGSTVDWGNEWEGRYMINDISLKSYFIQPTLAYKFTDWFAVGGSVIIGMGEVSIARSVAVGNQDATLALESKDAKGMGYSIGAYIRPHDRVNVGLSYRSNVNMEVEGGTATWSNVPGAVTGNMPFATNRFRAQLPLVSEFLAGVTFQATPRLMLAGEVGGVGWEAYRSLDIYLQNGGSEYPSIATKNYKNTFNYSFGAEYNVVDNFDVRLGYKFDGTPSPDQHFSPETPTTDLHIFAGGLGYRIGGFGIDAMAEYIYGAERNISNADAGFYGNLLVRGFAFGLGLSYNLGQ
ncbi:MAG: outer membrane protein transport protein [Weeksellaceae bacterium]|nr:outer membrane protein transport protein [Weeksellaceae bacterium]